MNTNIIEMNDCFSPNFQSHLDPFFKSFSVETKRGTWFRSFDKELARSALKGFGVNGEQKTEANRPRIKMATGEKKVLESQI